MKGIIEARQMANYITEEFRMKLNYKRTILVGFAFFLISAFWQAYDATIPVILTNKFGMSQTWSGVIMALDNILAVFMLPLFGALLTSAWGISLVSGHLSSPSVQLLQLWL